MRVDRRASMKAVTLLTAVWWMAGPGTAPAQTPVSRTVILATTTSTQDSGLLDVLVPMFEKKTGLSVKMISVGTGQALALAARGEADVTLAHAPAQEKKYVADGKMQNRLSQAGVSDTGSLVSMFKQLERGLDAVALEELDPALQEVTRLIESLNRMQYDLQVLRDLKVRVEKTKAVLNGNGRADEPSTGPTNGRRAA